jgi:hypothetical protein
MTQFSRLRDGELDGVKRALLESAMDDVPDERAEERALAFLGLGAGTAAVGAATGHSVAVVIGTHGVAASGVKGAGALTALTILKWVGIGAAVGGVVASSAVAVSFSQEASHRQETHAATALPRRVTQTNMKPRVDLPSATRNVDDSSPSDVPRAALPDVERAAMPGVERDAPNEGRRAVAAGTASVARPIAGASATEAFPQPSPRAAPSSVVDEVASLDVARAELAAGNAKGALAQLGAHDHAFPNGALTPEATVLRVRALVQLDELDQARTVARAFIASHPDGPQANHLRSLVGE